MSRLYAIVDTMYKEANLLADAGKLIMNNKSTAAGGALGGIYGAYKGSQGENGGLKGALVGGMQGAAGGAILGNVAGRVANAKAFKEYGAARKQLMDDAGVAANNRGFFSRNFGAGRAQLNKYRRAEYGTMFNRQGTRVQNIKDQMSNIADREGVGLLDAKSARAQIDALANSHSMTRLGAARDKLIFGGVGAGMLASTGIGLVNAGAKSGESVTSQQRMKNLRAKYQQTGQLDPREQRMLVNTMTGRPQGTASAI